MCMHSYDKEEGVRLSNRTIFLFICREKRRSNRGIPLTIMSLEKRMNDNREALCRAQHKDTGWGSLQGDMEKKHRWLT